MIINTDSLLDDLSFVDPKNEIEIQAVANSYNCEIKCDIEKHNALQYTYYYTIDFGKDEKFYVEIESGIDNGTRINHSEWGVNTMPKTKTIYIVKDIILNKSFYESGSMLEKKAQAVLNSNKQKLIEFNRKNNYDNYVTGGNSKMKLSGILNELVLEYIYEDKLVDCNFI